MKRVLVDVNVLLDVLLDRAPHAEASSTVWAAAETGKVEGGLAAHALTTIHYLVRKERGAVAARRTMTAILNVFHVVAVDERVIREALLLPGSDFEDNVTVAAAHLAGHDAIVTRNPKGFSSSPVRVISPEVAAALLSR